MWEYQGEIDRAGLACGTGMAKNKLGQVKIGTFQRDVFEGIGVLQDHAECFQGEFQADVLHGKCTKYAQGRIFNEVYLRGVLKKQTNISQAPDAAWYKDGKMHKAFDPIAK